MNQSRWHHAPHRRDLQTGIFHTWFAETTAGSYEIWQGRPTNLGGKQFVYELRRPDGTRTQFSLIAAAKKEVNDLLL